MSIDNGNLNPNPPGAGAQPAPDGPDEALEAQLQRYLDGRLGDDESQAVEELLRGNALARRRLDAMREEENLIRDAMETTAEPSHRLGDKVLAALHAEERARFHSLRNRRLARHVFKALAAAACLFLAVWLARPREAVGTAVSGTPATLITASGRRVPLTRETRIYEGDTVTTAQGQFVRLRLSAAGGAEIDVDEESRVSIEKSPGGPKLRLDCGRIGVSSPNGELLVELQQASVRTTPGAVVDIWLPEVSGAQWPDALLQPAGSPLAAHAGGRETDGGASVPARPTEAPAPAAVTVLSGSVFVGNEHLPAGIEVRQGSRVLPDPRSVPQGVRQIMRDIPLSLILETRRPGSLHSLDGVAPVDRPNLGLLAKTDFVELARRMNLLDKTPAAVAEALEVLQSAQASTEPVARVEKLAAGQQALRLACEALAADDSRRAAGRVLEGLAHLERGRALAAWPEMRQAAEKGGDAAPSAEAAFEAARVAFEEAGAVPIADAAVAAAASQPVWAQKLSTQNIADLPAADQTQLLAAFNHALARCWLARVKAPLDVLVGGTLDFLSSPEGHALGAAREFDSLRGNLGRSVEALAARLGEGLAWQVAGQHEKAVDALNEILAAPLAGTAPATRRQCDGIRQAALLTLVQVHCAGATPSAEDRRKALLAAHHFSLLYPLDSAARNTAKKAIEELLDANLLQSAFKALEARQVQEAIDLYQEYLSVPREDWQAVQATAQLLQALKEGGPSYREQVFIKAQALEKLVEKLPADKKDEFLKQYKLNIRR